MTNAQFTNLQFSQRPARAGLGPSGLEILDGKKVVPLERLMAGVIAKPGDSVVISGTLVEGIGNEFSDIDLHVLCGSRPRPSEFRLRDHHRLLTLDRSIVRSDNQDMLDEVFLVHSLLEGTAIKIDVEYDTFEDIARIERTIEELFDYAIANLVLLTKQMDGRDQLLLHRIETGILWKGAAPYVANRTIREKLRYLLYRWSASDFMMLLDCLGTYRRGELLRATAIARECLIQQAGAFVALLGGLNPRRKWTPVYLAQLYTGDQVLIHEFFRLYPGVSPNSEKDLAQYVVEVLDFIDLLYDEGRRLLQGFADIPLGSEAERLLQKDRDQSGSNNLYANMEFEYRRRAYVKVETRTADLLHASFE